MYLFYILLGLSAGVLIGLSFAWWRRRREDGRRAFVIESVLDQQDRLRRSGETGLAEQALAEARRLIDLYFPYPDGRRASVLMRAARLDLDRGELGAARRWLKEVELIQKRRSTKELDRIHTLIDLIYIQWSAGEEDPGLSRLEQIIETLGKKRSKGGRLELARALNVRSLIFGSAGRWERAEADLDRAIELVRRADPDHEALVAYYRNLADIVDYDRHEEALSLLEQGLGLAVRREMVEEALRVGDRIRGWYEDRPDFARESVYWEGLIKEAPADETGEEFRLIWGSLLGEARFDHDPESHDPDELAPEPDRPGSLAAAFSRRLRARLHLDRGEFAAAARQLREALPILAERLSATDPLVISLQLELGDVYFAAGSREAAVQVYEEVRSSIEEAEGAHHPDLPAVHLRLVEAMFDTAELDQLQDYCRRGIAGLERWGETSPLLSRLLYYLARTEMELGRPEEARSLVDRSLDISAPYRDYEGDGAAWFFLSTVEQSLGNFEKALDCVERARTNYEQSALDDDRVMGDLYARLSSIYAGKGDQTKCREFADQAMDAWAREKALERKGAEGGWSR